MPANKPKNDQLSRKTVIEALQEMVEDATQEKWSAGDEQTRAFEMGRVRGLAYAIKLLL